jgi:hypothetical protein
MAVPVEAYMGIAVASLDQWIRSNEFFSNVCMKRSRTLESQAMRSPAKRWDVFCQEVGAYWVEGAWSIRIRVIERISVESGLWEHSKRHDQWIRSNEFFSNVCMKRSRTLESQAMRSLQRHGGSGGSIHGDSGRISRVVDFVVGV